MSSLVFAYQLVGYRCLEALIEMGEKVVAVVTHHDDPSEAQWFPSVAELARKNHIPVYTPDNANDPSFVSMFAALEPDFLFSFYYRKILKPDILKIPKRGAFNMHGSLLPKYRGRACIHWAILMGETKTGVTLHVMEEKADTGDIAGQKAVAIEFTDTALAVTKKIGGAAHTLMKEVFPALKVENIKLIPQNHAEATVFGKRTPEDGRISWEARALTIYNLMRAVTHPFPGAFTTLNGKKLFVWRGRPREDERVSGSPGQVVSLDGKKGLCLATGKGAFYVESLQLENENEMNAEDFCRAHPEFVGARLGGQKGEKS